MPDLSRRDRGLLAILWLLIIAYAGTIPQAAVRNGDYVHIWVGGRTVAQGNGADLYAPDAHARILQEDTDLPFDEYWAERNDLLGVFFYPPPAGLLYAPLGALPLTASQAVQAGLNIALALWTAFALYRFLNGRLSLLLIGLLLLTYPSIFYTYVLGQNGLLTMALTVSGWWLWQQGRDTAGGGVLGLLLYKPNWLAALGWVPLLWRRWWVVVGMALTGGIATGLTAVVVGTQPFLDYVNRSRQVAGLHRLPNYPLDTQHTILSLFRRWWGVNSVAADAVGWTLILLILAATVWLLYPVRATDGRAFTIAAGLSWTTAVLLNPHLHHYDLCLTAAALAVAATGWENWSRPRRITFATLVVFHHAAFPLTVRLGWGDAVSLPVLAVTAVWGWLAFMMWSHRSTVTADSHPIPTPTV